MRYEYYSNLALVSSAVVYALAMFAHAAEWAAARGLSGAKAAERELVRVAAAEPGQMRPEPFDELRTAPVEGQSSAEATDEPGTDTPDADADRR